MIRFLRFLGPAHAPRNIGISRVLKRPKPPRGEAIDSGSQSSKSTVRDEFGAFFCGPFLNILRQGVLNPVIFSDDPKRIVFRVHETILRRGARIPRLWWYVQNVLLIFAGPNMSKIGQQITDAHAPCMEYFRTCTVVTHKCTNSCFWPNV